MSIVKTNVNSVGIFNSANGRMWLTPANFNTLTNNQGISIVTGNPTYFSVNKNMLCDITVQISILVQASGVNRNIYSFQFYNITDNQILYTGGEGLDSTNNASNIYRQFSHNITGIYQLQAGKDYDFRLTNISGNTLNYTSVMTAFSLQMKEFIPLYA